MPSIRIISVHLGISRPILEETRPLQYILEWGWIPSIRDFLHHINARITSATSGLKPYRENDSLLMDSDFILRASWKEAFLINRCRLALQVECVSDIATADGTRIDNAWLQLTTEKPSWSTKRWPRQGDPGNEAWSIWKKFIQEAFLQGNRGKLKTPLGWWITLNPSRMYRTYHSATTNTLWKQIAYDCWTKHQLRSHHRRHYIFNIKGDTEICEPNDILPLDIVKENQAEIITGRPSTRIHYEPKKMTTLESKIASLQVSDILFHGTKLLVDEDCLKRESSTTAIIDIASDGSHDQVQEVITYGGWWPLTKF
jgi:hypothetical protein